MAGVEEAVGRWASEALEVSTLPAVARSSHQQADGGISGFEHPKGNSTFAETGRVKVESFQ